MKLEKSFVEIEALSVLSFSVKATFFFNLSESALRSLIKRFFYLYRIDTVLQMITIHIDILLDNSVIA